MCPVDVGMAAHNMQPSSFALLVTQQQLGYSPSGQGQHVQHGPYAHIMPYRSPQYHTALLVQYGYMTSMGGPPQRPQPDTSWFPTAPVPVPVPYTASHGPPVDLEQSTEGEGHMNTYSRGRNNETVRNDVLHSQRRCPSPTPDPLKVKNARLQEELREVHREQIHLCHDVEHLRLERDHLLEKLDFMKDKGAQHPNLHPSYSNKEVPQDTSSKNSIGAN
jgi:hypothetical protein